MRKSNQNENKIVEFHIQIATTCTDDYKAIIQAKDILKKELVREYYKNAFRTFVSNLGRHVVEPPRPPWTEKAKNEAKDFILEYLLEEMVEQVICDSKISNDVNNDYSHGDSAFHEVIVDREYNKTDAIDLIEELYKYEEDDSGLWEGEDLSRILAIKAAYTFGNAVYSEIGDIIDELNSELDNGLISEIETGVVIEIIIKIPGFKKKLTTQDRRDIYDGGLIEWIEHNYKETYTKLKERALENAIREIVEDY